MPQYLVCNYMPDDFDPSSITEAMMEEIHALNPTSAVFGRFCCFAKKKFFAFNKGDRECQNSDE